MPQRYSAAALVDFTAALFLAAGLDEEKAATMARHLVGADLLGHRTHGLALAAPYLNEIIAGRMATAGGPEVISARAGNELWEGRGLPGPWLVSRAAERGIGLAREHGVATITIRRSHHIACLATYLERATDEGLMMILASSNPGSTGVAPFGGKKPLFTPNPIAMGIPTDREPILIDISSSVTANGQVERALERGERLPGPWLLDSEGRPTDDPAALHTDPPGTILPLGGVDAGHKGFALALMVEALTQALAGFGRADRPSGWRASVFLQVIDPDAFGGRDDFKRQAGFLADACRSAEPIDPQSPVRLPGERGLALRRAQIRDGVDLDSSILSALEPFASRYSVSLPARVVSEPRRGR